MKRSEVEHVLRAAAAITQEHSFVVVGSQAILLAYPHAPEELLVSRELDLYPALNPGKADLIDGAIGAMSSFDETFGYHADGVGPETAVMSSDWQSRMQLFYVGGRRMLDADVLLQRIGQLDIAAHPVAAISEWARRRSLEARSA
ncbi:hypothetical protein [Ramlibacter sp.]|uniref:hypothetical protein n=1 Tax=Ramlibacter sp. TaxID=1917967 RepID=UPI00184E9AF2|nr:hypothetical protein [Ramlibacter sp.]MBA2673173.1 hypothetical protein [Ramlibacter sp.]